jgi:hypothetical protein
MMYKEKLAVAIKHNGKILRENKDLVTLPFGSEFSVLVKNLDNRRVKFNLQIDGTDVLDGTEIIVNANSETEIKRYIRNGNMDVGNAFKFIERTEAIENGPRGVKVEDGIVRIEFWFENKPTYQPPVSIWNGNPYDYRIGSPWEGKYYSSRGDGGFGSSTFSSNSISGSSGIGGSSLRGLSSNASAASKSLPSQDAVAQSTNDAGITVPGSAIEQKFTTVYGFVPETQSNVIVLKLVGRTETAPVIQAITVKTKPVCTTCGRTNKATSKFCTACGTSLTLL